MGQPFALIDKEGAGVHTTPDVTVLGFVTGNGAQRRQGSPPDYQASPPAPVVQKVEG